MTITRVEKVDQVGCEHEDRMRGPEWPSQLRHTKMDQASDSVTVFVVAARAGQGMGKWFKGAAHELSILTFGLIG
jgi:hypothetical protein